MEGQFSQEQYDNAQRKTSLDARRYLADQYLQEIESRWRENEVKRRRDAAEQNKLDQEAAVSLKKE